MRNIKCGVADIRKRVFAEVAKLAYEGGDYTRMEKLPYEIVPGEVGRQRESVFLERAIVGERIRLAMGLPLRPVTEHSVLSDGVEESAIAAKYYDPPADQRHQVRLQCLRAHPLRGDQRMPGLFGAALSARLPQGGHLHGAGSGRHRPG